MANMKEKIKKETPTDMLARLMVHGFEKLGKELRQEFRQGYEELKRGQEEIKDEVSSLKEEQKDTNRRLISMERKQEGAKISMDETVHKSEFMKLERRVEVLEHK